MSSYDTPVAFSDVLGAQIDSFERAGVVSRTFRRLDRPRQRAIIDAFLAEGAKAGPTAVNVKKVAERAGVSVGSIYTYFPDRRALGTFVVELCVRATVAQFRELTPMLASLPLAQGLTTYLEGGLAWSEEQLATVRFLARAAYQGEIAGDAAAADAIIAPVANAMLDMVRAMLNAAQQRGELRGDLDIDATARVVHAAFIAVIDPQLLPHLNTYFQIAGDDCASSRTSAALVDLLIAGLAKRPKRPAKG